PAAAVVRYSALDTQHWLEVKQRRQRERDQRLTAALQRRDGGARAKKASPPRIDHRGTFPPLPLRRGRGRGGPPRGGRGGRGGTTNSPSSATSSSSSSSGGSRPSPWASTAGAADPRGGRGGRGQGERGR